MRREAQTITVSDLRSLFTAIEFPEYQREPTVWSREQKQRLIDSMFRRFDISAIYLYEREDGGYECIDGRQRLNAILAFLGENPGDDDNGFVVRIENEITKETMDELAILHGRSYEELVASDSKAVAEHLLDFMNYELATIFLSGSHAPEEFNLQFLRLNLGTLINAGEKLNAMVGGMRDLIFEDGGLGDHPFLQPIGVPTRRFAKEQIVAQALLQVFSLSASGDVARARHFDLQKFFKRCADVTRSDTRVSGLIQTLDVLDEQCHSIADQLRNRAISVSVIVAAWHLRIAEHGSAPEFAKFLTALLGRLRWHVAKMKAFDPHPAYAYLTDFQRNLTQAAVEKPAVRFRHDVLTSGFQYWQETGKLRGDSEYEEIEGVSAPWKQP